MRQSKNRHRNSPTRAQDGGDDHNQLTDGLGYQVGITIDILLNRDEPGLKEGSTGMLKLLPERALVKLDRSRACGILVSSHSVATVFLNPDDPMCLSCTSQSIMGPSEIRRSEHKKCAFTIGWNTYHILGFLVEPYLPNRLSATSSPAPMRQREILPRYCSWFGFGFDTHLGANSTPVCRIMPLSCLDFTQEIRR